MHRYVGRGGASEGVFCLSPIGGCASIALSLETVEAESGDLIRFLVYGALNACGLVVVSVARRCESAARLGGYGGGLRLAMRGSLMSMRPGTERVERNTKKSFCTSEPQLGVILLRW